jgi:hypothetical protein
MSLKIENSRRVAKSRPVCMDLKNIKAITRQKTDQIDLVKTKYEQKM